MLRRGLDIVFAVMAIMCLAPLMLLAAVGIWWSSPGPVLYRAQRVGRGGLPFTMFKLRTMHCREVAGSSITASNDPRVFRVGKLLRALKIDELPQLLNVVKGDMSIVGPRPEAIDIVDKYYSDRDRQSLQVRPGLTSPGSICYYTHGEQLLADGEAEHYYAERLLPIKMEMDLQYLEQASVLSDLAVICKTAVVLVQKASGKTVFPDLPANILEAAGKRQSGNPVSVSRQSGDQPASRAA